MIKRLFPVFASLLIGPSLFLGACHGDEEVEEDSASEIEATPETPAPEEVATEEAHADPGLAPVGDRQMTQSEVFQTRARLGLEPRPDLIVGDLLTRSDVRELTHYEGTLAETTLAGIPASPDYNAVRIASESGYGVGFQLWMVEEARQAVPRFRRLRETYFEAIEDEPPVGDAAFYGDVEGIRHYAFVHRSSRSVGVVTCEEAICSQDQLRALAERALSRL